VIFLQESFLRNANADFTFVMLSVLQLGCGVPKFYGESTAQEQARTVQSGFHCRHREPQRGGGFLIGKTFEVAEHDDAPVDRF
jgi:hypothetical protein